MDIEKILKAGAALPNNAPIMHEWGEILEDLMEELEVTNKKMYDRFWKKYYLSVFGPHLTKEQIMKWVANMTNEDGTKGQHWNIDQTSQVAKQYSISLDKYSAEEWYAVMNMIYSDLYGAIPNDISVYVKISQKWLEDKDVPEGKLFNYYWDVVHASNE